MPTARRTIQRLDGSSAAWTGKGSTQDVPRDRRRRRRACRRSARTGGSRRLRMLTEVTRSTPLTSAPHAALMFPTLSSAQIARIASRGVIRQNKSSDVFTEGEYTNVPIVYTYADTIE